jgi:alanine racemase
MLMENVFENDSKIIVALDLIEHNYRKVLKTIISQETKIIAMVKANAYGHGIVEVSKCLEKEGVDYLGVFSCVEAHQLREAEIKSPILIFGIPHHSTFSTLADLNVSLVVSSSDELKKVCEWTEHYKKNITIHIKVDTGMSRLGFFPEYAQKAIHNTLRKHTFVAIEGICTHFAESSAPDKTFTLQQGETFINLLDLLKKDKIQIPLIHASNSGAILHYPEFHFSAVRPGILIYGISPDQSEVPSLRPALSLESYVANIKTIPSGSYVSYGRTFQCSRRTTMAVIPLGYADGIPLGLSNRGNVIIHNHLCPIIGSICMNQFMVDISDCPQASLGSKALLLGQSSSHIITVSDIARQASTLPYDVLCRLPSSLHRKFVP